MPSPAPIYLFSVDLEDIRLRIEGATRYRDAVPEMTGRFLEFLRVRSLKTTFFVVGDVARRHPELIAQILSEGHEIGCHTDRHVPLTKQTPETFKRDLEANMESLRKAGATDLKGFRAPIFSLTRATSWAYEILRSLGIQYSSSVLPAHNPLYGWPDFGTQARRIDGIIEVPMTLSHTPLLNVPFAGGVYFRVLPKLLIDWFFARAHRREPAITGYFHPYDIDTEQERFMQLDDSTSKFYNWLMYYRRGCVFPRLDAILRRGSTIIPYAQYVGRLAPAL